MERVVESSVAVAPTITPAATEAGAARQPGLLYGRITDLDGATYEGRLRWGRDQEAFWSDYFNGTKDGNPWTAYTPGPKTSAPFEIFGIKIGGEDPSIRLRRLFMARFGDIARIDTQLRRVEVTLKSGTTVTLDRNAAGDIDDGVRVWDAKRGIVDLDARGIRTIEFLPVPSLAAASGRLYGTVRTRQGDFTGFVQWDQRDGFGIDTLNGRTADGEQALRYDAIRTIARQSRDSALVTLLDGREMALSGASDVNQNNRGIYIDDRRYGRVLVSWDAFEHADLRIDDSGPAYDDYPAGSALRGRVTLRDGRRLAGRLVYDFDESVTSETLDASLQGVDYNIPFRLIAAIVPQDRDSSAAPRAAVILHDGGKLQLERTGDLAERNAGLLIFADDRERPEYVPWSEIERIEFETEHF